MGGWTSALLVGFLQGLLQVGTAREEGAVPPELYQAEVRAIEVAAGGDLWFSVRGQGLARLRSGEISWVTVDDGLASAGVADLLEDRHGRLWAVGLGGFSVFDGDRWRARDGFADLQPRVIFDVYEEPDSDAIWLAASGGAGRLEDGVWTVLRTSDGLPHPVGPRGRRRRARGSVAGLPHRPCSDRGWGGRGPVPWRELPLCASGPERRSLVRHLRRNLCLGWIVVDAPLGRHDGLRPTRDRRRGDLGWVGGGRRLSE